MMRRLEGECAFGETAAIRSGCKVKRLVEYELESGGSVLVEVDEDHLGALADELVPAASPGELAAKAGQSFEQALASIKAVAKAIDAQVRSMTDPPDEASVEFGIT